MAMIPTKNFKTICSQLIISVFLLFFSFATQAENKITAWKIIPNQSSINFTATQNDAPVSGEFKQFSGEVHIDPANLATSKVRIVVNTHSLTTSYKELTDTLATAEWLAIKLFPQAIFTTTQIKKTGEDTYQANGNLTIRNKTVPVTVSFTLEENKNNQRIRVKGSTILKRTAFGVGQGEWSSTNEVKDDVTVNFVLTLVKDK